MTDAFLVPTDEKINYERTVLAGMMRYAPNVPEVIRLLTPDDFIGAGKSNDATIFSAIVALWEDNRSASGQIDAALVYDRLERAELVHHFQGQSGNAKLECVRYLASTLELDPTGMWCQTYAAKVKEFSLRRSIEHEARRLLFEIANPSKPIDELIAEAQRSFNALTTSRSFGEFVKLAPAVDAILREIDSKAKKQSMSGITTGLCDVDHFTDGLQRGELCLIGARPSVGKTAFGAGLAVAAARSGCGVLFFSLEQATKELAARLLAGESGVNSMRLRKGDISGNEAMRLIEAARTLSPLPILFNDYGKQTVNSIAAQVRRAAAANKIGVVVIDYMQLMSGQDRQAKRHEQLAEISRGLKQLAREMDVSVVAMAQLNRETEGRASEEPRLADLKDSGALEQDADLVILLHRLHKSDPQRPVDLIQARVAKNRNGPVGPTTLCYHKSTMRFQNHASEIPE
jgi:replicative DNA helicase